MTAPSTGTAIGHCSGRAVTRTPCPIVANAARDRQVSPSRALERQALRYEADEPVAGIFAVLERTGMTTEAALELLRVATARAHLALLGDVIPPNEVDAARHAARGMVLSRQ